MQPTQRRRRRCRSAVIATCIAAVTAGSANAAIHAGATSHRSTTSPSQTKVYKTPSDTRAPIYTFDCPASGEMRVRECADPDFAVEARHGSYYEVSSEGEATGGGVHLP